MLNTNQWFRSSFLEYRTIITLLYLAGIAFTSVSCSEGNGKGKKNAEVLEVPVFTLSPKSIEVPQTYVCDLQAIQFVEVRSKVEGFVENIYVDEGKALKRVNLYFSCPPLNTMNW